MASCHATPPYVVAKPAARPRALSIPGRLPRRIRQTAGRTVWNRARKSGLIAVPKIGKTWRQCRAATQQPNSAKNNKKNKDLGSFICPMGPRPSLMSGASRPFSAPAAAKFTPSTPSASTCDRGELLGVVGESGSGKSVTMMSLIGLLPSPPADVRAGQVLLGGRDLLKISPDDAAQRARAPRSASCFRTR